MKKRLTEKRIRALLQYSSIMVFLLAISYVLIITNPPSELLEYDNEKNTTVTKHLSWTEMSGHMGSISIFLILFAILAFFIGISTSLVCMTEGEQTSSIIFSLISVVLIPILALLLYPFYGAQLFYLAITLGLSTHFIGYSLLSPSISIGILGIEVASMLALFVLCIGFLVFNILPVWIVGIIILLVPVLLGLATGLALGTGFKQLFKYLKKRRRRKRRKKP